MRNLRVILCPIDFSSDSIEALKYAILLAKKMKVKLAILHISKDKSFQTIQKQFDEIASSHLLNNSLSYEFAIGSGEEKDEILRFSKIFKADMVVVGRKGSNSTINQNTGSTTKWLIHSRKVAVLSIPKKYS